MKDLLGQAQQILIRLFFQKYLLPNKASSAGLDCPTLGAKST